MEVEIDTFTDDDDDSLANSHVKHLTDMTSEMSLAIGRDFQISSRMKQMIEEAGFVDVQEHRLKMPIGSWATDPKLKDVGRFFERYYKTGLQGWLLHICTRVMGVSSQNSGLIMKID